MSEIDLNKIRISSPCNVPWESMKGTDRKRYCSQCHLNVYNISSMTHAEAAKLVGSETAYCFSLYRRPDGTVITRDCPVGVARLKKYLKWSVAIIGSFLTGSVLFQQFMAKQAEEEFRRQEVYSQASHDLGFTGPMSTKRKVVRIQKLVLAGEYIDSSALEEEEIEYENIPMYAVWSASMLEGKVAKYTLHPGVIVVEDNYVDPKSATYRLRLDRGIEEKVEKIAKEQDKTSRELLTEWLKEKLQIIYSSSWF